MADQQNEQKPKITGVFIDKNTHARLKLHCVQKGLIISTLVTTIINAYLDQEAEKTNE